ncbi:NadS family protein [Oceanospirillum sediminis]|uniref:Helix-turn-helix domain-containing protein n=1 Tax=Oceanospirillum sediminis TaxID=2760088 RepID=A0A839IZT5_9GAMM|nr:NadS family protein [Oceanospirillum sediminis]MBB1489596.1 helix-turn-helix domain-containing protein [Oceanospirillum sediminis]
MNDELFSELLASAEEMVAIENGSITPDPARVHHFDTIDVKAIRKAANRTQQEFASLIGASSETVRSWEMKRRNPSGTAKKLLILLQDNPKEMLNILEAAR